MSVYFISNQLPGIQLEDIIISSLEDCYNWCKEQTVLGVDTETSGLDFLTKKVVMLQIGNEERQYVIDTRGIDVSLLSKIFTSKDILKIFHNVKFDYKHLRSSFGFICQNVYDTMLVEQVLNCGRDGMSYSLESLCRNYLKVSLDKSVRNKFINLEGAPYNLSQIIYGAEDVRYLIKIRELQRLQYEGQEFEKTVYLENEASLAFADIEYNGIAIDREAWKSVADTSKKELLEQETVLDSIILTDVRLKKFLKKTIQTDLFLNTEDLRKVDILWSSPLQVLKVLRTLEPSLENVNSKELFKLSKKHILVKEYIKYKEIQKRVTSYGISFLDNIGIDNRIHTNFHQILDTGRVSSNEPNMQQIPASNVYRNCFVPGYKDWVFVSSDYSSQELCVIALKSKDPVWIECLQKGEDLHSVCADLVFGEEWFNAKEDDCLYFKNKEKCECPGHKKLRNAVKSINFGLAYGMTEFKLAGQLSIEVSKAKEIIDKYFKAFPSIGKFLNTLASFGKNRGYIKTFQPYFRRRYFSDHEAAKNMILSGDYAAGFKIMGEIERKSKNTPIQGTSADMVKRALCLIREYLVENPELPILLVMTVHDQIDTICHKDIAEEWKEKFNLFMEQAANESLPEELLKADTNITQVWEK